MTPDIQLPEAALARIDTLIAAVDRAKAEAIDLSESIRIHFLRNLTVEPIEPYLEFHVLREAIRPEISYGGYDSILQETLDPDSTLRRDGPDIVVVAIELSLLDRDYGRLGWSADTAIARLQEALDAVIVSTSAVIVTNTMLAPQSSLEGIAAAKPRQAQEVARLNQWIWEFADSHPGRVVVADWDRILRQIGHEQAIDQRFWRLSLAPFKASFLDRYAREVTKVARALRGRAKKCLVLDCDDTLWGGVVGEDGLEGIKLGTNDWPDRAFYEFQRTVLALQKRGVLVTLCSKNNEQDVWEVMDGHPDCLLKKDDLAGWRINWDDKPSNILALSRELNLSLDSFVFVDDNPREAELVRDSLPQVTVLQVPQRLYEYPDLLLRDGLFDTLMVSDEDRQRASLYRAEHERAQERSVHVTVDDYLASLDQTINIWPIVEQDRARVAQLTQKTNQFNLTTKRYSEGQIEAFMNDPDAAVFAMSVKDRHGDLGTTGVLISRRNGDVGGVDSLLLSCRVLGRKLEFAFVDRCLAHLEERWSLAAWSAEYRPTRKNEQVAEFWLKAGFSVQEEAAGVTTYTRPAGQPAGEYEQVMSIVEARFDATAG